MENWQNSRQGFVDEMLRVYDKIGANTATGHDSEKSILIDREKLRALREKANRVDELEDEVSNLTLQKRARDFGANEAQLLQEKTAENARLAEENARLTEDVENYAAATSRAEKLAQENQRLNAELQRSLLRLQEVGDDEIIEPRPTPVASDIPSSVRKIKHEGTELVAADIHRALVTKYNILAQNWSDLKAARNKIEATARKYREKTVQWANHADGKNEVLARKEDTIRQLKEQILALKGQLGTTKSVAAAWSPATISSSSKLSNVSKASNPCNVGHAQVDEPFPSSSRVSKALCSSAFEEAVSPPQSVEVATSSPALKIPPRNDGQLSDLAGVSMRFTTGVEIDLDSSGLLRLLSAEGVSSVDDTEFEIIGPHHSSSTEGEVEADSLDRNEEQNAANPVLPINLTSSPAPVVISARSVRKRKGRKDSNESPAPRIKVETISSSPIGLAAFLDVDESIDLDEIGEKQATPRKKRPKQSHVAPGLSSLHLNSGRACRSETLDSRPSNFERESEERSQSIPLSELGNGRRGSPLLPLSTNRQILPRTSDERAPKRRRVVSHQAVGDLLEDGTGENSMSPNPTNRNRPDFVQRLGDLLDKPSPLKNAITPVSGLGGLRTSATRANASVSHLYQPDPADDFHRQRYQGNAKSEDSRRPLNQELAATVYEATKQSGPTSWESVKEFTEKSRASSNGISKASTYSSRSASKRSGEVSQPLSNGLSEDSTHYSRPTVRDSPVVFSKDYDTASQKIMGLPATRKMPWDEHGKPLKTQGHTFITPTRPPSTAAIKGGATTGRMTVFNRLSRATEDIFNAEVDHPQNEPLRSRPIHKLDTEDFKINPHYNQGYKHAFNEVVRNKEDRRCLQGCTKPDCCGTKWRALAREELARRAQPPTPSQEESETTLLEEFMGDNAYKLRNMKQAERSEMLIQAKTRDLANKFGRHRHAYERRSSPPGFWRFEFPNTQQQKEDAEKADAQRREQVRSRYEEAMRPGGRFLFRDE